MAEKYIELQDAINADVDTTSIDIRFGIQWTLEYLDARPDQVPGRTMTERVTMTDATFNATTYPDTEGVYFAVARGNVSFAMFFTPEEIVRLKEVLENATR